MDRLDILIPGSTVAMVIVHMHGVSPKVLGELRIIPKMSNLVYLSRVLLGCVAVVIVVA